MYGHTLGSCVAMGYVGHPEGASEEFVTSGRYEIQLADQRVAARASLTPMYDPKNLRIR
jgi:4-methylaminobutanoate oxidase (formaldehyde-forming)